MLNIFYRNADSMHVSIIYLSVCTCEAAVSNWAIADPTFLEVEPSFMADAST